MIELHDKPLQGRKVTIKWAKQVWDLYGEQIRTPAPYLFLQGTRANTFGLKRPWRLAQRDAHAKTDYPFSVERAY